MSNPLGKRKVFTPQVNFAPAVKIPRLEEKQPESKLEHEEEVEIEEEGDVDVKDAIIKERIEEEQEELEEDDEEEIVEKKPKRKKKSTNKKQVKKVKKKGKKEKKEEGKGEQEDDEPEEEEGESEAEDPETLNNMTLSEIALLCRKTTKRRGQITQSKVDDDSIIVEEEGEHIQGEGTSTKSENKKKPLEKEEEKSDRPKIRLVDGKLVVDEDSLIQTAPKEQFEPITVLRTRGGKLNQNSFRRVIHSPNRKKWTPTETRLFYKSIRIFGPNLSNMGILMRHRSRHQLRDKLRKEEKENPHLVDFAIHNKLPISPETLKSLLSTDFESDNIPTDVAELFFDEDEEEEDEDEENGVSERKLAASLLSSLSRRVHTPEEMQSNE